MAAPVHGHFRAFIWRRPAPRKPLEQEVKRSPGLTGSACWLRQRIAIDLNEFDNTNLNKIENSFYFLQSANDLFFINTKKQAQYPDMDASVFPTKSNGQTILWRPPLWLVEQQALFLTGISSRCLGIPRGIPADTIAL
jgi:hypothetical protein